MHRDLIDAGQVEESVSALQKVLEIDERLYGPGRPLRGLDMRALGLAYRKCGKDDLAERLERSARQIETQYLQADGGAAVRKLQWDALCEGENDRYGAALAKLVERMGIRRPRLHRLLPMRPDRWERSRLQDLPVRYLQPNVYLSHWLVETLAGLVVHCVVGFSAFLNSGVLINSTPPPANRTLVPFPR